MFQYVKHGNGCAAARREWGSRKRSADRRNAGAPPCRVRCVDRKIEAGHGTRSLHYASLGQHLQEQSAAASGVQDDPLGFRFPKGALDEIQMIAQNEAPIALFYAID